MEFSLKGIIAIAGKPGLYKVIAQGHNNNVIVESLIDKKRMPAYATSKISALEDITMYSTGESDKPLHEIIKAIYDKENGGAYADAKDESKHAAYLKDVFADYDSAKIYPSDIRKLFSWYNLLQSSGELARIADEAANPKKEEETEKPAEKKKEAKVVEKKPVEKKATEKKVAEKKPATKEKKEDKKEEKADKKKSTEKKATKKDSKTTVKKTAAKSKTAASSKAKSSVNKKSTGSKRGG